MKDVVRLPVKKDPLFFLGKVPNCSRMPKGHFYSDKIKVSMAVGMYQFHDLLSNHNKKENDDRSLFSDSKELSLLNI